MKYALTGMSVEKSFSKQIHEMILHEEYLLISLKNEDDFNAFLKDENFKGINVTIPYKKVAYEACDILSDEAKEIGVVNTVIKDNGKLFGYNTDAFGLEYLIDHNKLEIREKSCLIMGTGATSKTAKYVLNKKGAKVIKFLSRNPDVDTYSYDDENVLKEAEIIVNTTPNKTDVLFDVNKAEKLECYIDVLYNPIFTKQALEIKKKNIKVINGLRMLVAQAVKTDEIFSGQKLSDDLIEKTYQKIFAKERNILLIGHPLSGKTTIAKRLAKTLQMEILDTDQIVEEKYGMTINQIFEEFGEENFRKVESEVLESLSNAKGKIISSGGGIILKESNISYIRNNAVIINLNRDIENVSQNDLFIRPLLKSKAKLIETIKNRQAKYKEIADFTIENKSVDQTVEAIRSLL